MLRMKCLLLLLFNQACFSQDPPEVETGLGKLRGEWRISLQGRTYAAFEGIPYSKPPVGDLRFEGPVPVEPWPGVWDATKPRACIQTGMEMPDQDEDCLYLNVYVPSDKIDPSKNYDVVVHIHGGGFMRGAGHLVNAKFMMDRDVVVVSLNYRLGVFGFISTEDDVIPGNNGLKDQNLALKWIKQNIASFGGNTNSITLTGMSAGAASTQLHYLSPLSRGLFSRGFSHGGSALNPWVIKEEPLQNAKKMAVLVGCPDSPSTELKNCIKTKASNLFSENMGEFFGYEIMPVAPFSPVIEKNHKGAFLTKQPYIILKEKDVLDVPYIISTTADEGIVLTGFVSKNLDEVDKRWTEIAQYLLDYTYTLPASKYEEVANKIKEFYLGPGQHINKDNFIKLNQMFTDRIITLGSELSAKLQSAAMKSPVYYYLFNYKGDNNKLVDVFYAGYGLDGVCHNDDAIYFYGFLTFNDFSDTDMKMWKTCQDMLYSYAHTGTPSFDGVSSWTPTKDTELTYLQIDKPDEIKLQTVTQLTPIDFWKGLGMKENENLL